MSTQIFFYQTLLGSLVRGSCVLFQAEIKQQEEVKAATEMQWEAPEVRRGARSKQIQKKDERRQKV